METFLASQGRVLLRMLERYGIDGEKFVRAGGHSLEVFRDPAARLPSRAADEAALGAAALIPNPGFALEAARCWHPSDLGAFGFAWLASSTLHTALQRLARYGRILGEKARFHLETESRGLRGVLDMRRHDPLVSAIAVDFWFSLVIDMCRMNFGASLRPLEVTLRRAAPVDVRPWRLFYGGRVQFGCPRDSFLLARADIEAPLSIANRQVAGTLDVVLAQQLATLDRSNVAARTKAALLERLGSGEPAEEEIAKSLHMSRRTLQRKLAEADLTYQRLVDDTRRDLALRYIEDPAKSVTELTFLLGFSGQSAFTRAFRRWTGASPTEYRAHRKTRRAPAR